MTDFKVTTLAEVPHYQGPHAIAGMRFHTAGRALGVTAWGMNVLAIDAGCTGYPEHDHLKDGQEEVYVVLEGSGTLEAGGEKVELTRGSLVRVGPSSRRKFLPGARGLTLLAIGGTPGQAYAAK